MQNWSRLFLFLYAMLLLAPTAAYSKTVHASFVGHATALCKDSPLSALHANRPYHSKRAVLIVQWPVCPWPLRCGVGADGCVHRLAGVDCCALQEKLRLDMSDEDAVEWMQQLLNDSATALTPQITDRTHRWATYWLR